MIRLLTSVLLFVWMPATALVTFAQTACEKLPTISLPEARIFSATLVPALQKEISSQNTVLVAAHCEVKGLATPTSDSLIHFELWLPTENKWNGKYMQIGSGGWAALSVQIT
jgi:feruloyl esterase